MVEINVLPLVPEKFVDHLQRSRCAFAYASTDGGQRAILWILEVQLVVEYLPNRSVDSDVVLVKERLKIDVAQLFSNRLEIVSYPDSQTV